MTLINCFHWSKP